MSGDVAARLADGEEAVDTLTTYVAACRAVDRPTGGLTVPAVREWYAAEAGLKLDALDADSAALAAMARTAEESVAVEGEVLATMAQVWQGESGSAAQEFVQRHWTGGAAMVTSLREASAALASLRHDLGALVDAKVEAVMRFDDRRAAEHPIWLAGAEAVLHGRAGREAAAVVNHQIGPYVDDEVGGEWLPAMRAATDSVSAAYDDALLRLADGPAGEFTLPGEVPEWEVGQEPAVGRSPAVAGPPERVLNPPSPTVPAAPPGAPVGWSGGFPAMSASPLPDFGGLGGVGGLGGANSSLPGLVGQIADLLGGYSNAAISPPVESREGAESKKPKDAVLQHGSEEPQGDETAGDKPIGESPLPGPAGTELPAAQAPAPGAPQPLLPQPVIEPLHAESSPALSAAVPPPLPPPTPLAAEVPLTVVPKPAARPTEPSESKTPCAIAAEELAQVGQ